MGHLRRRTTEGGREQMKDELNKMLSARMCTWVKDSNVPTCYVHAKQLSSINAFAPNLRTPGLS